MPQDHALGDSLTRVPRTEYRHSPSMVGGAVHGAECNMHAVVLIHSMALGDDLSPFE